MRTPFFLPYQTRWIRDQSPLKLIEKSRQIGISFADAYDSVMKAGVQGGLDVWVSPRDEAQARLYLEDCRKLARTLQLAAQDRGEFLFDRNAETPAYVLEFASGRKIYSLSSNPNALAGKRGHVKLDEFALHEDQRLLYQVAKPVTTWGGQLSIISTHRGHGSLFNQLIRDIKERANPMGWSFHSVSLEQAVEQGLVEKINRKRDGALGRKFGLDIKDLETANPQLRNLWLQRIRAECLDEAQWLQEYCCTPAEDSASFITFEMVAACEDPELKLLSIEQLEAYALAHPQAVFYAGVDVARKHDLCVIDVGEKLGDVVWSRLRLELRDRSFSEIEADLFRLLKLRQFKRACLDATGLGLQLAERAERRFGWKVEPVTFTAASKEEMAFGLRADFEDRRLRLPADERLRADIRGVKKEVTSSGNLRFSGESGDGHCDRFWALALRQQAARQPRQVSALVGSSFSSSFSSSSSICFGSTLKTILAHSQDSAPGLKNFCPPKPRSRRLQSRTRTRTRTRRSKPTHHASRITHMKLFGYNISISRETPTPQLVTRSLSLSPEDWLAGRDLDRGPVLNNAYQQVVWVYRAINALAEQVANVPFLFSAGERGRENLITSGPLLDFYNRPHPQINRFEYWELRVIWLMLRGECFRIPIYDDSLAGQSISAIKNRKSKIKNLVILDPAHFQHIIQDHQLVGWRYTGFGASAPLESQIFLPEEVWFEKLPNPFDFWRGMPPLYAAAMAAQADFAASSFMRGIIENNGDTGLIVRSEKPLDPDQEQQIIATIRDRKRCAGFADKPTFLAGVSEIIKPALSSSDLQFLENRKFSRAEICAAFGVPEEILTATDHAKYDVMQGARLNFIENRVAPLCRRLEAEEDRLIHALRPGAVGWFDLDSLPISQQAQRNRLATAKLGFDMGIPFNELNRVMDLGFKRLPWGDNGYLPANLTPAETTANEGK